MADWFDQNAPKKQGEDWFDQNAPQQAEPVETPAYGPQAPQTLGHSVSELASGANPLSGLWQTLTHPLDTIRAATQARQALAPRAQEDFRKGHNIEGVGHWIENKLPFVGPAMAALSDQIAGTDPEFDKYGAVVKQGTQPDIVGGIARAVGTGGGLIAGPAIARGAGAGVRGLGSPLVRTALQIPAKAEAWGANPAKFILENTSSLRPPKIANEAGEAVQRLTSAQDAAAAASKTKASLVPARNAVSADISKAAGRNSVSTPRDLAPMQRFLTEPQPGFSGATEFPAGANTPISFKAPAGFAGKPTLVRGPGPMPMVAAEQPALDALGMRRQFDTDFIQNWNPNASTKGALGTARKAYHEIGREVDRAIPGGAARDEAIQSGIGAQRAAEAASLRASLGQRILGRISRPTGGLVPAMMGYASGGTLGATAGLTAAEAAASPVPLMGAARGLFGTGAAIQKAAPLVKPGVLLRARRPEAR